MPHADKMLEAAGQRADALAAPGLSPRPRRHVAVLACMDTRIDPLAMLGLEAGDAKILRNAGARVTEEVLGTLVVARYLLDVERLMVIAHTGCRMVGEAGDLEAAIRAAGGPDTSGLPIRTAPDQEAAVRSDVELARSFESLAGLQVGGFLYDVETGRLSQLC
jgi:carbonic anhydrase